jgi:hypothetical protein
MDHRRQFQFFLSGLIPLDFLKSTNFGFRSVTSIPQFDINTHGQKTLMQKNILQSSQSSF